ncbi:hypothetical protein IWW39_000200 [Coemansia spiralis]|uniref:Uncharacterized protein n=1 Tax=Coemansia spiralis TaxID=417178 RepID=A0A9W8GMV2_9FUNG|nr:hypothetical protein IWW39_000200 [Coemansia spiralis]
MRQILFRFGNLRFTREFAPFLGILSGTVMQPKPQPGPFLDPSVVHNNRSEIPASMLGTAADAWFGCTAAQWVEETRRAGELFHGHQHEAQWLAHMAEQLLCFISMGLCGGAVGQYRGVALRRDAAPHGQLGGRQQYVVTRLCASKGSQQTVTIVEMWRQIVQQAQSAAGIGNCGKDSSCWDFASALAAGPFMESLPERDPPPEEAQSHTVDTTWGFTWDSEPALQPVSNHLSTPSSSHAAPLAELDMDSLVEQHPELFSSFPLASALSPAVLTNSQAFSWSQWEESCNDDTRYNLFVDSQASEWKATPATADPRRVYDATPPDTMMRRLAATPESVARDIRAARKEPRVGRALDLANVPRILAPATPAHRPLLRLTSATVSGTFVPETPILQRTHSLGASLDCVPETPLHKLAPRVCRPPPRFSFKSQVLPPPAMLPEKKKRKYNRKKRPVPSASKVRPLSLAKSSSDII